MSVGRPAHCVFCLFKRPLKTPNCTKRTLQTTSSRHQRNRDRSQAEGVDRLIRDSQGTDWSKHYTAEQVEAIRAAEKVIPKAKFEKGLGPRRHDPLAPQDYIDNLSEVDPVVDKPRRAPWENLDDNARLKTRAELSEEAGRVAQKFFDERKLGNNPDLKPEDFDGELFDEIDSKIQLTTGKPEAFFNPPSAVAPTVPSPPKPEPRPRKSSQRKRGDEGPGENRGRDEEEASPALVRLMQMTGYDRSQIAKLRVKSVLTKRVTNQTRLGKVSRTYVLTVAGNGKGLIGLGEGKSEEMVEAKLQSQYRAIRNMQPIMRYENRTVYGDLEGKVGATELELYARPPGFGLRCQQYIWEIAKCAGIYDLAARVTRSRNPMNTVKATVQALMKQKDPEDIARARGKKMVDVRKVYYAGQV